jgi:hypothetical protein
MEVNTFTTNHRRVNPRLLFSTQPCIPSAKVRRVTGRIKCAPKKKINTSLGRISRLNLMYALYNIVVLFLKQVMHDLSLSNLYDVNV